MTYYCAECDWIGNDLTVDGVGCPNCGYCISADHANEADLDEIMGEPLDV